MKRIFFALSTLALLVLPVHEVVSQDCGCTSQSTNRVVNLSPTVSPTWFGSTLNGSQFAGAQVYGARLIGSQMYGSQFLNSPQLSALISQILKSPNTYALNSTNLQGLNLNGLNLNGLNAQTFGVGNLNQTTAHWNNIPIRSITVVAVPMTTGMGGFGNIISRPAGTSISGCGTMPMYRSRSNCRVAPICCPPRRPACAMPRPTRAVPVGTCCANYIQPTAPVRRVQVPVASRTAGKARVSAICCPVVAR